MCPHRGSWGPTTAKQQRTVEFPQGSKVQKTVEIALSAGCLGLQSIDAEKSQLVREEGLQALRALTAGCPVS